MKVITPKETKEKRVKPIILRDPETGDVMYTLDFSASAVKQIERSGFSINKEVIENRNTSSIRQLVFFAFNKHHKTTVTSEDEAWSIVAKALGFGEDEDVDGDTVDLGEVVMRLYLLYNQAILDVSNPNVKKLTLEL